MAEYFTAVFHIPPPFREPVCRFRNIKIATPAPCRAGAARRPAVEKSIDESIDMKKMQ
ncbi:MAG: hypothetical protein V4462_06095 [Pseudomonadota bacterium]